jgi:hypothetical protein
MNTNPTTSKVSFLSLFAFVVLAVSSAACSSTAAVASKGTTARLESRGGLSRVSFERASVIEDRHDVGALDRSSVRPGSFTQSRLIVRR